MSVTNNSTGGGSVFSALFKLALIGIALYWAGLLVAWGIDKVLWIYGMVKSGFITGGKVTIVLLILLLLAFLFALFCDLFFLPLFRKVKRIRKKSRSMANCRFPSLYAFRTGKSKLEGSTGDVERFMASLLRERYQQIAGALPDANTFRNNESAFSSFKTAELPKALLSAKPAIEQGLFAPLVTNYRITEDDRQGQEA